MYVCCESVRTQACPVLGHSYTGYAGQGGQAKLALLHHITQLDNTSLAKQVYTEQNERGWPGLVAECKQLSNDWQVPDITEPGCNISKVEWKTMLKKEAKFQNSKWLMERI